MLLTKFPTKKKDAEIPIETVLNELKPRVLKIYEFDIDKKNNDSYTFDIFCV